MIINRNRNFLDAAFILMSNIVLCDGTAENAISDDGTIIKSTMCVGVV